jgi:hypothetical protein
MIENSVEELKLYKDLSYIQQAEELRENDYTEMNSFLFTFLDKFTNIK